MAQVPDPPFMESININMRVPERLSVAPSPGSALVGGGVPPAYTMHIPERLTYSEVPDLSPRSQFKPPPSLPVGLEPCWEICGEAVREGLQSPIRRSYSDQSFGRTPPSTPTHLKQALTVPRHPSSSQASGISPHQHPQVASTSAQPHPTPTFLSPQFMLQTARQLGQQASQRLLQALGHKYHRCTNEQKLVAPGVLTPEPGSRLVEHSKTRTMVTWSPEEDGGSAVELIILRRQVMKMSRRLAALERHSANQRNTEVLLFSLLISACLLNAWLWIRR